MPVHDDQEQGSPPSPIYPPQEKREQLRPQDVQIVINGEPLHEYEQSTGTIVDLGPVPPQPIYYNQPQVIIPTAQPAAIIYERTPRSSHWGIAVAVFAALLTGASVTYTILAILVVSGYEGFDYDLGATIARIVSGVVGIIAGLMGILSILRSISRDKQYKLSWTYILILVVDTLFQTGINLYSTISMAISPATVTLYTFIASIFLIFLVILSLAACMLCTGVRLRYMRIEDNEI
jgi:hypothetical protein